MAARVTVEPLRNTKKTPSAICRRRGVHAERRAGRHLRAARPDRPRPELLLGSDYIVNGPRRRDRGSKCSSCPGPASIKAEWMRVETERRGESVEDTDLSPIVGEGWYVSGTYALTGEKKADGLDRPKKPLFQGGLRRGRGRRRASRAWSSRADRPSEQGSRSPRADTILGNRDQVTTFGVNWYVNRFVKIQANFIREKLDDPSQGPLPVEGELHQPRPSGFSFRCEDIHAHRVQASLHRPRSRSLRRRQPRPRCAQTAAELFDANTIQEIRLSVNSRDLATLRAEHPAEHLLHRRPDVEERQGPQRRHPLARAGQPQPDQARPPRRHGPLHHRADVRRPLDDHPRQHLAGRLAAPRAAGLHAVREAWAQPAPRESFCRLYINNEYQGLYAITEEIDGDFAKRVTGETDGTVFEFHWFVDTQWRAEDLGAIANYKPLFEPRTHVLDADSTLYNPIQQLFKEVNGPDDAVWRTRVEQYLDLNQFMTHVGDRAVHRRERRHPRLAGHEQLLPLPLPGHDEAPAVRRGTRTRRSCCIDSTDRDDRRDNVLFRRAMAYPDLRETYLQTLEDCARIAADRRLPAARDRSAGRPHLRRRARRHASKQFDRASDRVRPGRRAVPARAGRSSVLRRTVARAEVAQHPALATRTLGSVHATDPTRSARTPF